VRKFLGGEKKKSFSPQGISLGNFSLAEQRPINCRKGKTEQ
jgi:hypothetical protein